MRRSGLAILVWCLMAGPSTPAPPRPWDDPALPPARRAALVLAQMTKEEKLGLVHGGLGAPWGGEPKPPGAIGSAGFIPGVPRLGIPPLQETDAELGIGNPGNVRPGDTATAMPSNLALASSWDPDLARRQGAAIGEEARQKGFNLLLGGAASLIRDPRGGRDFEYFSEDPLLTGVMAGAEVAGIQSRNVISTVKHFVLNAQETDRVVLDARIDRGALRESDLLAFELAIEQGHPLCVMCAYNQVNGDYACENSWLLDQVLKRDWAYPGFVVSDWGAVHSTIRSALGGLDQESGEQLDEADFFAEPLAAAVARGEVPQARLDDMARRILTSIFAAGFADRASRPLPAGPPEAAATARAIAAAGTVMLKNAGVLPLSPDATRIAVFGGHADRGVLSGGGSSQVVPTGGPALSEPAPEAVQGGLVFDPSAPLAAIRRHARRAVTTFSDGHDLAEAARQAATADVAVVFATQWKTETADVSDLALPGGQDALIETVATANPRTLVVLETGGPVLMPWLGHVAGVIEAWYPGQDGAEAMADVMFGTLEPAGRLPITFPSAEEQLSHRRIAGDPAGAPPGPLGRGKAYGPIYRADYPEGALVGYKWFEHNHLTPLFPFGFGLSYTRFGLGAVSVTIRDAIASVDLTVKNTGDRAGMAIPQVYVDRQDGSIPLRLAGWSRLVLAPGEERRVTIAIDPRLLARFDEAAHLWQIAGGPYRIGVGFDAAHPERSVSVEVEAATLPP